MGLLDKIESKLASSKHDKAENQALDSQTSNTHTSNLTGTSAAHNPTGAGHAAGTGVAGGVAEHELHKHHGHNAGATGIPGNTGNVGTTGNTASYDPVNASAPGHHNTHHHNHPGAGQAVGAGVATGVADHELHKHHGHTGGLSGNNTNTGLTGNSGSTNLTGTHHTGQHNHNGALHTAEAGLAQHELNKHHNQHTGTAGIDSHNNGGLTGHNHHNNNNTVTGAGTNTGAYNSGVGTGTATGTGTGPAPHTIGPHSSDAANVVDPRVQPDPRLQDSNHARGVAGGVGSTSNDHHHGHHQHNEPRGLVPSGENHSAIPTAGGIKVGSGGDGVGNTTSTIGEQTRGHHHTGTHHNETHHAGHHHAGQHHSGSERAAEAVGAAGATGAGPHGHHNNTPHAGTAGTGATQGVVGGPNSGVTGTDPGLTTERKLGGAYEAGYRDATSHHQAQRP